MRTNCVAQGSLFSVLWWLKWEGNPKRKGCISFPFRSPQNTEVTPEHWGGFPVLCCCSLVAQSCLTLCDPIDCSPPGSSVYGDSPGKNTGVNCHGLLQGIFLTQGSNPGLPHCRWIFYHLSHQGSPRILEWVAYFLSRGSSWPRNWTEVFCIAGRFFTSWATREALPVLYIYSRN